MGFDMARIGFLSASNQRFQVWFDENSATKLAGGSLRSRSKNAGHVDCSNHPSSNLKPYPSTKLLSNIVSSKLCTFIIFISIFLFMRFILSPLMLCSFKKKTVKSMLQQLCYPRFQSSHPNTQPTVPTSQSLCRAQ